MNKNDTQQPILYKLKDIANIVLFIDGENRIINQNNFDPFKNINGKKIEEVFPEQQKIFLEAIAEAQKNGQSTEKRIYIEIEQYFVPFSLNIDVCKTDEKSIFIAILNHLSIQNKLLLEVVEKERDSILIFNQEGKILYWNKNAQLLSGYSMEEISNVPIWNLAELLGYNNVENTEQIDFEVFKNNIINYQPGFHFLTEKEKPDQVFTSKSGEKKYVNNYIIALKDEYENIFCISFRDLTEENEKKWHKYDKEEFLRAFFDKSAIAEVILEANTNLISNINEAALNIFKLKSSESIQNKPFSILISPTSEVKIDEIINNIDNQNKDVEIVMLRADDSEWIAKIHSTKFKSSGKMFIRLSLTDITNIRFAASQLSSTNDHLQAIFKVIPDEIFIVDYNGYVLDYTNKGTALDEKNILIGLHLNHILDTRSEALVMLGIQNAIKNNKTEVVDYQIIIDDTIKFHEARISKMSEDSVLMMLRDTTNVSLLENDLHHSNRLLKMISHLATSFINQPLEKTHQEINNILSQIGEFVDVDQVYILSFDWSKQTIVQTHNWCVEDPSIKSLDVSLEDFNTWTNICKNGRMIFIKDFENEKNTNNQLSQIMKDCDVQSFMIIPLMESGFCIGAVGFDTIKTKKDLTHNEISFLQIFAEVITNLWIKEKTDNILKNNQKALKERNTQLIVLNDQLKKQNEEILAKNIELDNQRKKVDRSDKLKTSFLNNVSHEIRTPLNGIVGFSQLLAEDNISLNDKKDYASALRTSVDRLTDTINDIMDVSLLMSGNMPTHIESVSLVEIFNEIYNKHIDSAQTKDLQFTKEIPPHLSSMTFDCDKGFIRKIVNEITANAIKYTKEGSVTIGFSVDNSTLCIYAKDTGIGISDEVLPHIKEAFVQGDYSTTRHEEGSGLGLTIVTGIVDLLKGKIDIQTEKNKGTTISIYIKFDSVMQQIEEKKTVPTPTTSSNNDWPTVLVAEDEDLNILYVKRIFKAKSYNVIYARNGKEAVDAVEANPNIDIILMDIKMPIMTGLEATGIIKKSHPKIKIIAVTAYSANDDRITCLNAGCDDYVSKPFRPATIFELMDKWLAKE